MCFLFHFLFRQQWVHLVIMKLKQSRSFFNFILDRNTTKKQIHFIFLNLAHIHVESIIEIVYNLLENKYIKVLPSLKKVIKRYKKNLLKFTTSLTKSLSIQKSLLKKNFRLFYFLIRKSKNIILLASAP